MRYPFKAVLPIVVAFAAAGCSSFLNDANDDPNNPTDVTRPGPLYISVQALQSVQFEGQLARNAAEYVQQIAGTSRQSIGFDLYQMDPTTIDPEWLSVYASSRNAQGGGGLLDVKKMQQRARAVSDTIYLGIGKVYEALIIGMAASVWGDIPYREAADSNNLTPAFDPQLQVYSDVLAQLDSAITFLSVTTGGTNVGPPSDNSELIFNQYGADSDSLATVYREVAHSLKARYYLHLAELDPSNYARALSEAQLGISVPEHDMLWYHDLTPTGQNVWWQFQGNRGDIAPGAAIIEILKRRGDTQRLNFYFTPAEGGGFFGFRPAGLVPATAGSIDNGSGSPEGNYSDFNFINFDIDPGDLRMPILTYAETQLIAAEAAFQSAGGAGAAAPFLNEARAKRSYGARGNTPVTFLPLGAVPATLQNIMEEKYVTLFLNIEAWNDYKRTCLPSLAPAPSALTSTTPGVEIAGRVPYGISDINANPNTPDVESTARNANDPNPCPRLDYTTTTPRGN
jgi:hypothetical protein